MSQCESLLCNTNTELVGIFRALLRIRRIEESFAARYAEWKMRCPMHLSIGQEAIPIGMSMHLEDKDHVFSNHRSHGHYLAKGGDLRKMVAELYGKLTGCSGGRGGSMHLIDINVGFMGATPIVGGTVPLAVGDAWAASLKGIDRVSVIYLGDGCFEQGIVHESMNFAALHRLPVIFVCENNGYSVFTQLWERQPDRKIVNVAKEHGLETYSGDGNDVLFVSQTACAAVKRARDGNGPQFLEFQTYRWLEHCGPEDDDDLGYRIDGELALWKSRCPVEKFKTYLVEKGVIEGQQIMKIERDIKDEIEEAFAFALRSPEPEVTSLGDHIYA